MDFKNVNLEELNDYIIEELGMELMDEDITSVTDVIKGWNECITSKEFKDDDHVGDLEIIKELSKFIGYDSLYSINSEHGGTWGQAYIILDKQFNYIGNVVTI